MNDETFQATFTVTLPGPTYEHDLDIVARFRQAWLPGQANQQEVDRGADAIAYTRHVGGDAEALRGWEPERVRWAASIAFLSGLTAATARGEVLSTAGVLLLTQEGLK